MYNERAKQFKFSSIRTVGLTILTVAILATGCDRKPADQSAAKDAAAGPVTIYTTFYPTAYFAERIAGDLAKVVNPCPPDADPAFWTPDEQTIAAYQKADLIVINGASFEKWIANASLPPSRVVDTTMPFEDEFIVIKNAVHHSHGPAGEHSHEGVDGHTWLDPVNAKTQANEILKALVKLRPDDKSALEKSYAELAEDLDELDARLKSLTEKVGDQKLYCSHPAYNYVGRRYGWDLVTFHLDPGEMPDEETLQHVREHVAEHGAHIMLWESEPTDEIAGAIAEMGLMNVVYSPCEAVDPEDAEAGVDFLSVMNGNVDRLKSALQAATNEKPETP